MFAFFCYDTRLVCVWIFHATSYEWWTDGLWDGMTGVCIYHVLKWIYFILYSLSVCHRISSVASLSSAARHMEWWLVKLLTDGCPTSFSVHILALMRYTFVADVRDLVCCARWSVPFFCSPLITNFKCFYLNVFVVDVIMSPVIICLKCYVCYCCFELAIVQHSGSSATFCK